MPTIPAEAGVDENVGLEPELEYTPVPYDISDVELIATGR
jgi:hypothetical protein